jgi:hypothetical protein
MYLRELVHHSRGLLADTVSPHAWTDAQLTNWINDAERRFAESTFCFVDASSPLSQLTTTPG